MRFLSIYEITIVILLSLGIANVFGICCWGSQCSHCKDCTPATPFCATGPCNIFGCNCDGECRTGVLCPVGRIEGSNRTIVEGILCNAPYDFTLSRAPFCGIAVPGRSQLEWVHACNIRERRAIKNSDTSTSCNGYINIAERNVSELYHKVDLNSDGHLTLKEARRFLLSVSGGYNKTFINRAVIKIDVNNDGFLTMNEIDGDE